MLFRSMQSLLSGGLSGLPEAGIANPAERIKIFQQTHPNAPSSSIKAGKMIMQSEGVMGLYKGYAPLAFRCVIGNGTFFTTLDMAKQVVATKTDNWTVQNTVPGFFAGIATMAANNPLDVMNSLAKQSSKPKTMRQLASQVIQEHGVKGFWKGLEPRLWRPGPGGAIMATAFSWFMGEKS